MAKSDVGVLCRLCFASEETHENLGFSSILPYSQLLATWAGLETNDQDPVSQNVCSLCEEQILATHSLHKRIQLTQVVWTNFHNPDVRVPLDDGVDQTVVLNCHLCSASGGYEEIMLHMVTSHENHDCSFCKSLMNAPYVEEHSDIFEEVIEDENAEENFPIMDEKDQDGDDHILQDIVMEEEVEDEVDDEAFDSSDGKQLEGNFSAIVGEKVTNEQGEKVRRYSCHICDKSYMRTDKLRIHLKNVHDIISRSKNQEKKDGENICNYCGKMFGEQIKLDRHLLMHSATPFECNMCDDPPFSSRALLNEHRLTCHTGNAPEDERPYMCRACKRSYARLEQLKKHLQTQHPEQDVDQELAEFERDEARKRFACHLCDKSYTRVEKRDEHMKMHGENPFNCDRCDSGYATRAELKVHQNGCTEPQTLFKCRECPKKFISRRLLLLHQDTHENKEFLCSVAECGATFSTRILWNTHMRTKHEKPYECPICGKRLSRKDKISGHMKQHQKVECSECGEEFEKTKDLTMHRNIFHPELDDTASDDGEGASAAKKRFQCHLCTYSYVTQKKLDAHLKDSHDPQGYQCNKCDLKFDSKIKLKGHWYKHNAKLCGICGVWIANSFAAHMRRHEGIKPFKCEYEGCGKQFLRNCDLTAHSKSHTGERPFACDYPNCNMSFSRPYKVAVHKRTHTGEKPYKCDFKNCNRTFAQSFDLTLHMRRHTGEKPHECDRCGERFILGSILKRHQSSCKVKVEESEEQEQLPVAIETYTMPQATELYEVAYV